MRLETEIDIGGEMRKEEQRLLCPSHVHLRSAVLTVKEEGCLGNSIPIHLKIKVFAFRNRTLIV